MAAASLVEAPGHRSWRFDGHTPVIWVRTRPGQGGSFLFPGCGDRGARVQFCWRRETAGSPGLIQQHLLGGEQGRVLERRRKFVAIAQAKLDQRG